MRHPPTYLASLHRIDRHRARSDVSDEAYSTMGMTSDKAIELVKRHGVLLEECAWPRAEPYRNGGGRAYTRQLVGSSARQRDIYS